MGTHWEVEGNIVATHGTREKMENCSPRPPQTQKRKYQGTLNACFGLCQLLHQFFPHNRVRHHFLAWSNTFCKEPGYRFIIIIILNYSRSHHKNKRVKQPPPSPPRSESGFITRNQQRTQQLNLLLYNGRSQYFKKKFSNLHWSNDCTLTLMY